MKRILIILSLLISLSARGQVMIPGVVASSISAGGSTETVSDDFQSYNTGDIGGQGNWVDGDGSDPGISVIDASGDKRVTGGNSSAEAMAYYNASNIGDDHYVEIEIDAVTSDGNYIGVATRCSQTMNYYGLYVNASTVYFFCVVGWEYSDIINAQSVTIQAGDVIGLSVDGTTLTCYLNGSVWTALGSAISPATGTAGVYTDTRISSGEPGVCAYGDGQTAAGDNFYVEDL